MQAMQDLPRSPTCGLCNYPMHRNETTKIHNLCSQRFHEKCFIPAFNFCTYCFAPLALTRTKVDLLQLLERVNQVALNNRLDSQNKLALLNWLSQYKNNEVKLNRLLHFVLQDFLIPQDNPVDTAVRHAAFFDVLLTLKALKERGEITLLDEKMLRSQYDDKALQSGLKFLGQTPNPWIKTYIDVFNHYRLRSPFPHRILEGDKKLFRLKTRQDILSNDALRSNTAFMRMSEQELMVLKDQPELKAMVQLHLDGQKMFRFFMGFTALLIYSMALVAIGANLNEATRK